MHDHHSRVAQWTAVSAVLAWVLANALDVLSVLFFVQTGGQFAFACYRPAEHWLIYAGLRMLGTLGVTLLAMYTGKRWPGASQASWGALSVCALATAFIAWQRIVG